ncbi:hypothetical protein SDC9_111424 [bioreactor metagenome]|uniref:Uncharacterized protein n=1 Tax=bioreactor metagenome TaxID=1076179 RepID=A0A645BGP7_9ZZZZ|nr:hypothetical protein [Paludibacter sp.]
MKKKTLHINRDNVLVNSISASALQPKEIKVAEIPIEEFEGFYHDIDLASESNQE